MSTDIKQFLPPGKIPSHKETEKKHQPTFVFLTIDIFSESLKEIKFWIIFKI